MAAAAAAVGHFASYCDVLASTFVVHATSDAAFAVGGYVLLGGFVVTEGVLVIFADAGVEEVEAEDLV